MRTLTLFLVVALAGSAPAHAQTGQPETGQGYGAWFGSIPDLADVGRGILLEGTSPGSPAAKAGLRKGDVITMMAGDTVRTLRDMVTVLRLRQPGDEIDVIFLRDTKADTVKVTLGVRPGD